jgi:serine/threonine protein kinase
MHTLSIDPFELVGTTIAGKYDVEEIVAQTALSAVYRATHRVWQRSVAIKAFTAPTLSDEARQQLLTSFVEEGRLLMDLSERCASICQARDVSSLTTAKGEWVPYTVLEWLDGECLETILRRERAEGQAPRTLAAVVELLNPIAEALGIAHERGVVHRDVKPGNLFVLRSCGGESPRAKLLDFGVAKVMRGAAAPPAGAVVTQSFTPSYGAPEQFSVSYGTTGPWTDVYALGLIVVELLTGREALEGEAVGGLASQSCDPNVRPTPRTLGAVVSDEVESVLQRALAVRLEERFVDARALWSALRAAQSPDGAQPVDGAQPESLDGGHVSQAEACDADEAGQDIEVAWDESGESESDGESGSETDRAGLETVAACDSAPDLATQVDPDAAPESGPEDSQPVSFDGPPSAPPSSTIPIALSRRRGGAGAPHVSHATEDIR